MKSENSRLALEYDDQLWLMIENSGMCIQEVSFASDKCLDVFWWKDNRGVVHWFRDNDWKPIPVKSDSLPNDFKVGKTVSVKSEFLPVRAIGPSNSNSHLDCKADKVIVEDLVCSGE